ncbi:cupin domain-containing protein [Bowmanella sp. Y26]|uniref:cupin domain-containing protein n=1 Tax=Bowmanella yangjiangensis TaxID=2811230 RepID=UPI001BDD8688|nr:cupin domain-containing protein [Bowmanella yangjiangensis]MBT1063351.1 cupin domain-containing protein [Bowmanella yangjiangensis]
MDKSLTFSPNFIHLGRPNNAIEKRLSSSIDMIRYEAQQLYAGSESIIIRLAEIMLIQSIRHWLACADEANEGWFAAMRSKRIGAALQAIHQHPEKNGR